MSTPSDRIGIYLIHTFGAGHSSEFRVCAGKTTGHLVEGILEQDWDNVTVRINRASANMDYVLQQGDRVTVNLAKIEGA